MYILTARPLVAPAKAGAHSAAARARKASLRPANCVKSPGRRSDGSRLRRDDESEISQPSSTFDTFTRSEVAAPGSARCAARGQAPRPSRRTHLLIQPILDFLTASKAGTYGAASAYPTPFF